MFEFRQLFSKIEKEEMACVVKLLAKENLTLEQELDETFALYDDDQMIATASIKGDTFRCIAIEERYKGSSVINMLMTKMMQHMQGIGRHQYSLFTKPEMAKSFTYFGFSMVMAVNDVVLMSYPSDRFETYLKMLSNGVGGKLKGTVGSIVMNGNPFTNGHRYLIETAKEAVDNLIVFVVEEDASVFKYKERFDLIKRGTEDLKNVHVIPSGQYIISQATFPGYFLSGKNKGRVHGQLDLSIFGKEICKSLGITKRFVGTEPYCENTNLYNTMMKEMLPTFGIEVTEIPRLKGEGADISASRIRHAIKNDCLESIKGLVPPVTYEFLTNNEIDLKSRLKENTGRH